MEKKCLIVIDGNAVIHRAFHALPSLTTKKGEVVNAIYGFLSVFLRALRELRPDFIAVAFDFPAPSFRHQKYKLYKANREKAPDELYQQIPKTKNILEELGIKIFEKQGFEADDAIATIARSVPKEGLETIIISGDADTMQLVDDNTKVYYLRKGVKDIVLYDREKVKEKYDGLAPENLADFKGLRGDPSDNIPGVFGVGEKTATVLLKEFGSIENLYLELEGKTEKSEKIKESLRKKLLEYKDQAFLSKELGKLNMEAPIDFDLEKCRWSGEEKEKISRVIREHGFGSLADRFLNIQNNKKEENLNPPAGRKKSNQPADGEQLKNNLKLW